MASVNPFTESFFVLLSTFQSWDPMGQPMGPCTDLGSPETASEFQPLISCMERG